jgi:hypothetical protein
LRFDRMPGLDEEQLSELEYCVAELLKEPRDKGEGRPRELTLREALVVTCGYLRQNIVEEVWGDIFGVDHDCEGKIACTDPVRGCPSCQPTRVTVVTDI